ncbi:MAG: NAD(P)/FAD-dependent oxidoreductase, partial [Parvibaculum sp.]
TLMAPAVVRAASGDVDVAIVGAGSAGLAAAHSLIAAGHSVAIVEAAGRIGGRAHTDTTTFGLPFDRGCSWLHSSDVNPYTAMAREWGYTLESHDGADEAMFVGKREPNSEEWSAYSRAWRATRGGLSDAGRNGLDVPASEVVPAHMDWGANSQTWLGPMSMGKDFADLSPVDRWSLAETKPNLEIREGFGTLVTQYGQGLPVTLNAPVTAIDHSGPGVRITSAAGRLTARACILTVSTGVLAAETIRFTPGLPLATLAGIEGLPMGLFAKVPLLFDGKRFGLKPNQWLAYKLPEELPARACFFLTWPFDTNLMIGIVGGAFGWEMSARGDDAVVDFALGELRKIFGGAVDRHFIKGGFTNWANDPWVRGSYASERPGRHGARAKLAEPIDSPLFLAGEALAGTYAMTCGGANLSGTRVAADVAAFLRG